MRIFVKDNKIDDVCILLEYSEAIELRDSLNDLIEKKDSNLHHHINNRDFSKEITVALEHDGMSRGRFY